MQSRKVLTSLLVIGLLIALMLSLRKKSKFGLLGVIYMLLSPHRKLLKYAIAQAKVESANFTSKVYQTDNNMFGMKVNSRPFESPGLMSPEGQPYAHYERDFDSIRDFVAWLQQVGFPTTVSDSEQYAIEMKRLYKYGPSALTYQQNLDLWLK